MLVDRPRRRKAPAAGVFELALFVLMLPSPAVDSYDVRKFLETKPTHPDETRQYWRVADARAKERTGNGL